MRRIAISGHCGLPGPTAVLVEKAIRVALEDAGPHVTGISCLADGADQIFARAITDLGGVLEAIIPANRYRDGLPAHARHEFDRLLALASNAFLMPFSKPTPESFMAASELMIDTADELYAVWDGKPARGSGGTADVVAYARDRGKPVSIIWPPGAHRDLTHLKIIYRRSLALWSLWQPKRQRSFRSDLASPSRTGCWFPRSRRMSQRRR